MDHNGENDKVATENVIKKIRKGLEDLAVGQKTFLPPNPKSDDIEKELALPDGVSDYLSAQISISVAWEQALWQQSNATKVDTNRSVWYLRLLASYFFLLRTSVVKENINWADSVPILGTSTENRVLWRTVASMVSSIVHGLSSKWGSKAYLVIQALAGKKAMFPSETQITDNAREKLWNNSSRKIVGRTKVSHGEKYCQGASQRNPACLRHQYTLASGSFDQYCHKDGVSRGFTPWVEKGGTLGSGLTTKRSHQSACRILELPYTTDDQPALAAEGMSFASLASILAYISRNAIRADSSVPASTYINVSSFQYFISGDHKSSYCSFGAFDGNIR